MKPGNRFLQLFVPMAAVILLGAYLYREGRQQLERNRIETSETLAVSLGAGLLDRRLQLIVRDLRALAGNSAIRRLAENPTDASLAASTRDLLNFSAAKEVYDQIRWIDRRGQEVVRIDTKDGHPEQVDASRLQNKADRYYFKQAIALPPGRVYLSPLDLNIEQEQVEHPFKPVLRVATPVADGRGETRGIVVLNYLGADMIGQLRDITAPVTDHLMLVNGDGYFLHAPNPAEQWGFMFDKPDLSLAQRYPASWARLQTTERGQFEDDNGLWTVSTVHPLQATGKWRNEPAIDTPWLGTPAAAYQWKIVTHLPPAELAQRLGGYSSGSVLLVVLLLLASAAICRALARAQSHEAEVATRFRIYFERAMVGMAVSTVDKRWQLVNPALCQILGYSAAALCDKTWAELTHPDDLADNTREFDSVIRGEKDGYELVKRFVRADGQIVATFIAAQAVRKPDGKVDYFLLIVDDITARLAAENALRASEERLRRLGDNLPNSYIYQCKVSPGSGMSFVYVSSGVRLIHGIEPDEVLRDPQRLRGFIDPAQRAELEAAEQESLRTLSDFSMELRTRRADGDWGWLLVRSRPRREASGEIIWDGVATDISERRRAAALLDLSARRSETLLDLPRQSSQLDEQQFLQYALDQVEKMTDSQIGFMHFVNDNQDSVELAAWSSRTTGEFCTAAFDKHYPIQRAGLWADAIRQKQAVITNDYLGTPLRRDLPDGHAALARLISLPVVEDDKVKMVAGIGNKATPYTDTDVETVQLISNETWRLVRQKRDEQALRIAAQVVGASPVVCFRWRASEGWPVVFVSDNVARWGYAVDALMAGKPRFSEIIHPDDLERVVQEVKRFDAEGRNSYAQEYRLLTAGGEPIWVIDRTNVQRNTAGAIEFYDGVLTDISERKRREQEQMESLAAQRTLNKRLEEAHNQLLQSEKMASIGQLAAGVAHELNNPIGFVHSNLGTLEGYLRDLMDIIDAYDRQAGACPDKDVIERMKEERDFAFVRQDIVALLSESKDGLGRVRKIVQDLKNFSHVSEQEWQWADLHQGLDSTLNIVWNELKYKCKVVKEYGQIPEVYCLISQLNQVFMNLLVNAGHAIEQDGVITLRTARHNDHEVSIDVVDSGKGIPPENLKRIFEPFFTTKPVGKGTGLGLSLSYGIVDKHHGRIEVDSLVGVGTTFRIILPIEPAAGPAGHHPETTA